MRKRLFAFALIFVLMTSPVVATDYYACQDAQNLTGDATWCTLAQISGPCAATAARTAWATVAADSPTLYANGCTVVINDSFTAVAITTAAGAGTAGGGFTLATGTVAAKTFTTAVTAGTTDCVTISGNGAGTPVNTFVGAITGGASTNADGITSAHTVGTIQITGDVTGGAGVTAIGYSQTGTGLVTITGSATGVGGPGFKSNSTGAITISGNCTAHATAVSPGCDAASTGSITVSGSMVAGDRSQGGQGSIRWTPSNAQKYVSFDGGGTVLYASAGLGSDAGGTQVSAANTAAEISTGKYFIKKDDGVYTQGTKAVGASGGAWGF